MIRPDKNFCCRSNMDDAAINVLIAREIISKNSPNVKIVSSRFMYPSLKNNDANSSIH